MSRAQDKLIAGECLTEGDFLLLLQDRDAAGAKRLAAEACDRRERLYGRRVFLRGLIEISNHCKNDCLYCGIRRGNKNVSRYRLTEEEIVACCEAGYAEGLRSFVLQGGEDVSFSDERLCALLEGLKARFPDCALTLSLGERSTESYRRLRAAGADRYLLRHETADPAHYAALHPQMSYARRMDCLTALKSLGYQVGCGFMVGSPGQEAAHLAKDLSFLQSFRPHMAGIGPFLPHHGTPLAGAAAGSVELTLTLLSITRLLLPGVLLPATTALGTAAQDGILRGLAAGANVVMPNLSPPRARERYVLYDGRARGEGVTRLQEVLIGEGYDVTPDRGDGKVTDRRHPLGCK